jgi:hypothetical protein
VNADTTKNKKLLAPPKNMVPVYIGGGVALASFITAVVVGVVIKGNAQDNADSVAGQIKARGGVSSTCTPPIRPGANGTDFTKACSALQDDIDAVNADATVGNVFVGVGIAALVGTGIYWVVADKKDDSQSAFNRPHTTLTPILGRGTGGLSLSGTF